MINTASYQFTSTTKYLAIFGLIAKGILYFLTGLLVFLAAFNIGGKNTSNANQNGAFNTIMHQPAGKVLLVILAIGILSYAVWRFLQAFADTEHKGKHIQAVGKRVSYAFSGLTYFAVSVLAFKVVLSKASTGSGKSTQNFANKLLDLPHGQWLIIIWALILAGIGAYQIGYGLSEKFKKHIGSKELSANTITLLSKAGKIGYSARGIVWLIVAFLLVKAGLHANASEAGDTSSAFSFIKDSPFGAYLLAVIGIGLVCYAILNFFRAAYDRF